MFSKPLLCLIYVGNYQHVFVQSFTQSFFIQSIYATGFFLFKFAMCLHFAGAGHCQLSNNIFALFRFIGYNS